MLVGIEPGSGRIFGDLNHPGFAFCLPCGAMRTFRDESNRDWTAFKVTPDALIYGRVEALPPAYAQGWLVFESKEERRRLAPCPPEWETFPNAALRLMLERAEVVRYRRRAPQPRHVDENSSDDGPVELR